MNIKNTIIGGLIAVAAVGAFGSVAAADGGVHHPDCATVKDLTHTVNTPISGTVYIKAGPNHYDAGYHDAGWDVPAQWNGKDTSHYDVCGYEPPTTTTEVIPSTTTIPVTDPPTTPPTTQAPPTSTNPPTTTEPPVTSTEPPGSTSSSSTTSSPPTTDPGEDPYIHTYSECGYVAVVFYNRSNEAHTFALFINGVAQPNTIVQAGTFKVNEFHLPEDSGDYTYEAWIVSDPSYPVQTVSAGSDCLVPPATDVTVILPATNDIGTPPVPPQPNVPAPVAPVVPTELPSTGAKANMAIGAALVLLVGGSLVALARRRQA